MGARLKRALRPGTCLRTVVRPGAWPPDSGQGRPESKSAPNGYFCKHFGSSFGLGPGRQTRGEPSEIQKTLQMATFCKHFEQSFGRGPCRQTRLPPAGVYKCSKWLPSVSMANRPGASDPGQARPVSAELQMAKSCKPFEQSFSLGPGRQIRAKGARSPEKLQVCVSFKHSEHSLGRAKSNRSPNCSEFCLKHFEGYFGR